MVDAKLTISKYFRVPMTSLCFLNLVIPRYVCQKVIKKKPRELMSKTLKISINRQALKGKT